MTNQVIKAFQDNGLKLNKEKCQFYVRKVKLLGHILSEEGIKSDPEKIVIIKNMKIPNNINQLQRLLVMITYLAKCIPACSEITATLRELLKKDVKFIWDFAQKEAFDKIKMILASPPVLGYYNVNLPVKLTVDASSKALGAVLLQNEHPINLTASVISYSHNTQLINECSAEEFEKRHAF